MLILNTDQCQVFFILITLILVILIILIILIILKRVSLSSSLNVEIQVRLDDPWTAGSD